MNTVYLKSDITFEPDCNYMLKIRIDAPNQRIFYIKKSTLECTFDQACQNPEDPTCLHYLDSEGNFYLGKAGLVKLNDKYNNGWDAWDGVDGFFPYLEEPKNKTVCISVLTIEKLHEKIFKGLEYNSFKVVFTEQSAAWIIRYQGTPWRKCVLKAMKNSDANIILRELNELFAKEKKLGSREADKALDFINAYKKKLNTELIAETVSIFSARGCDKLNPLV